MSTETAISGGRYRLFLTLKEIPNHCVRKKSSFRRQFSFQTGISESNAGESAGRCSSR